MRPRYAMAALVAVLLVPLVAEAQLFRRWRQPAYPSQCVNGQCDTTTKTAKTVKPEPKVAEAPQPDIPLPTVDGRRWRLTFFYSPKPTEADMLVATWVFGHPQLKDVANRTVFYPMRTDKPEYTAKNTTGVSWRDFVRDLTPALVLQDPLGNRVYSCLGFRGEPIQLNGSPMTPLPESPDAMAAEIKRAVLSWKGFNQRLGQMVQSKSRAAGNFPPLPILTGDAPEAAPEGPIIQGILDRMQNRRQQWYQYRHQDQETDEDDADDVDVAVDLDNLGNEMDLPFTTPPVTPVQSAVVEEEPVFPTWLIVVGSIVLAVFLFAIGRDAVVGSTRQVGRHVFKSLND